MDLLAQFRYVLPGTRFYFATSQLQAGTFQERQEAGVLWGEFWENVPLQEDENTLELLKPDLGGGFKVFLFSRLLGEDFQFD